MRTAAAPLIFRVPPYLISLQFLVTAGLAAWNIYGSPSSVTRAVTILIAVSFLAGAIASMRMYFVVDDEGMGIRRLFTETSIPWQQVRDVSVTRVRNGSPTISIERQDGTTVDVPPSLVNPTKPTGTAKAMAMMGDLARAIAARNPYR